MSHTRHDFAHRTLERPLRGDAEPWQYVGVSVPTRALFDPATSRVRRRPSLKVNAAGWRILLNVLRIR
jgi:hypothetical protein